MRRCPASCSAVGRFLSLFITVDSVGDPVAGSDPEFGGLTWCVGICYQLQHPVQVAEGPTDECWRKTLKLLGQLHEEAVCVIALDGERCSRR